jgi:hypothetical protein
VRTPRLYRASACTLAFAALGACSSAGNILGSVLGGGQAQPSQVTGTVQGVDTRNRQIGLQQSNGQSVVLTYDDQTQVVYQNRSYAVTNLERGDRVTARVQSSGSAYYTDLVQVDQSVQTSNGSIGPAGSENVQSLQGTVNQVDRTNGLFTLDASNNVRILVSLPSNASRADVVRFQSLRSGDYVRLYGVFVTSSRVDLRQFY